MELTTDQNKGNIRRVREPEEGDAVTTELSGYFAAGILVHDPSLYMELWKTSESRLDRSECKDLHAHEFVTYTPAEPISCSIQTLEELLAWQKSKANQFNVATIPLAARQPALASCPRRTLVSHDMMGGYLDDRFVQGTESETPYAFYHWQYIDIFNYFTHKLVTIPPVVWTNSAHKHGVIVLGTFITEWTDGAKVCEAFLKEEESYRTVADKLVQISHHYAFDGWLVNIENSLSAEAVRNMPLFLRYLTDQMHERVVGSMVLWYDSVVEDGKLRWQNELNKSNRVFFDACDGFFTNYNWAETSLEGMVADDIIRGRQADIYVGVDVFARGDVVGGMFDTNKALELIRKHNFSAAIFAPGWAYESLDDKTEFRKTQDKFWALLSDFLYTHQVTASLPLTSSFCQGFGKAFYLRGQLEERRSWFNLSAQELQPLYHSQQLEEEGWFRSCGCPEDAWNGGSSLLLEGLIPASSQGKVCVRLFSLNVPLATTSLVTLVFKPSPGIKVSLELQVTDASLCTHEGVRDIPTTSVIPVDLDDSHAVVRKLVQICGDATQRGWTVRCSQVEARGCVLREVFVCLRQDKPQDMPFTCRVGEITIMDVADVHVPAETVGDVNIEDIVWLRGTTLNTSTTGPSDTSTTDPSSDTSTTGPSDTPTTGPLHLNATLRWQYPTQLVHHFRLYWRRLRGPDPRIPAGPLVRVGRCYSTLFRVTELEVPEPPTLLELVVEPVLNQGFLVSESHWGRSSLSYTEKDIQNPGL